MDSKRSHDTPRNTKAVTRTGERKHKSFIGGNEEAAHDPLLGYMLAQRFQLVQAVGKGTYGNVYRCLDTATQRTYAAKIEERPPQRRSAVLGIELSVFNKLKNNNPHVPYLVASGNDPPYNYLVMELLGQSVSARRHSATGKRFSLATTLRLTIGMIDCIRAIHDIGYVHRDIKPGNFTMGRKKRQRSVYVIDFGIAQRYLDSSGSPLAPRSNVGFRGTTRYASIHAHQRRELSPRDDYWSLLFAMIEMLLGRLPWDECRDKAAVATSKFYEVKHETLTASLPSCFRHILTYLKSLTYHDQVDHTYVSNLVLLEMRVRGIDDAGPLDWETDDTVTWYKPASTNPAIDPPSPIRYYKQKPPSSPDAQSDAGSGRSIMTVVTTASDGTAFKAPTATTTGGSGVDMLDKAELDELDDELSGEGERDKKKDKKKKKRWGVKRMTKAARAITMTGLNAVSDLVV